MPKQPRQPPEWARPINFTAQPQISTPAEPQEDTTTEPQISIQAEPQTNTYTEPRSRTSADKRINKNTDKPIRTTAETHKRINTGMYAREDLLEKCRVGAFMSKPRRSLADVLDEAMEDIVKKYGWEGKH